MTAKIFTTNNYGEFYEANLFEGCPLSGIITATKSEIVEKNNFLGFGVAITGSSCYNLSLMEKTERRQLLKSIYSKDGLNLSVGRLTIGSSDYSAELYTYDDTENDITLQNFSVERDTNYIIPIIKEIIEINPEIKLFASPWSPPAWMKTGGSIGGGFMREKYLECYADYFVKYVTEYKKHGIELYAITPQNETETHQDGTMPACIWHPEIEAKFINILRKKFDENNINTKIWAFDHNFIGVQRIKWSLEEFPQLQKNCDGIAFHYYSGDINNTKIIKELYPRLSLHFTEGGPRLYDNYDTDWCKWSLMMIRALNCGYSSFTGWNLMLDETGGPNIGPFFCGGLVTRNKQSGALSYSGQYKAFRHFSSFINRDSKIYRLNFENYADAMSGYNGKKDYITEGCAIENADGKSILIMVNPTENKKQIQYKKDGKVWYIELLPNTVATICF